MLIGLNRSVGVVGVEAVPKLQTSLFKISPHSDCFSNVIVVHVRTFNLRPFDLNSLNQMWGWVSKIK